jgi:7,8-dihydropterin-6-yl-methyl-4-(beta-D-ribofuranosyl)aminobenzene 5'-phosphate synthase
MEQIKSLKITTLAENLVQAGGLGQWGLAFLLELEDAKGDPRKVVFDTGMIKEAVLHNAKIIEEDFKDVDCVVLSHGHLDHTATTTEIVAASGGVKVYGHPHTFLPKFSENKDGKRRRIDPPEGERLEDIEAAGGEVILNEGPMEVVPGLWTTGEVERKTFEELRPADDPGRWIIEIDGEEFPGLIMDDLSLYTDVDGVGPWVITGCAHSGPVNTLLHIQKLAGFREINGFVGGTHLVGRPDDYVKRTIDEIAKFKPKVLSPCHCTCFKAINKFWQAFPEEFVLNFSLRVIEAGKENKNRLI